MTSPNGTALTFDDVVLGRRSIRGYRREPVPKSVIKEVIEIAMRAPSSLNTQPWNFYVVAGEPLQVLGEAAAGAQAGTSERPVSERTRPPTRSPAPRMRQAASAAISAAVLDFMAWTVPKNIVWR